MTKASRRLENMIARKCREHQNREDGERNGIEYRPKVISFYSHLCEQ